MCSLSSNDFTFSELAAIIDDPRAHPEPSTSALKKYGDERIEAINLHIALMEAKETKQATSNGRAMSDEALQKRKAREQKKALERTRSATAALTGSDVLFAPDSPGSAGGPSAENPAFSPPPTTPAYTVTIPPSSSFIPWYTPGENTYATLAGACTAGVWTYPSTQHERAKCGVFRGLWEQGYFMGGGIKFGGDFLIYPGLHLCLLASKNRTQSCILAGDPLRYHSHFVASVIDSPVSTLRPMEIVAHGRLGTATKKAHLLCGWDGDKQEVSYFSIEWAGFG